MIKKIISGYLLSAFILLGCSANSHKELTKEINPDVVHEKFNEGIIEMGMYSNNIDLGHLINKIDFSKNDVNKQFADLIKSDAKSQAIFERIESLSKQNALAGLAITLNLAECTYLIKNEAVLGKVRGFGWTMDNFHNRKNDEGSLYLETLVQNEQFGSHDKKVYSRYKPSAQKGAAAVNAIDFTLFNREVQLKKQNVSGYECDVIVYTPKETDSEDPQLKKLVVYSSTLFDNTINFAHPYYLDEVGGILRLDVYLTDMETASLVMKPKSIQQKAVNAVDLVSKTALPVYTELNTDWAVKSLGIMMSGWGMLNSTAEN